MRTAKTSLIDAVMPLVARGATALALSLLLAGCDCTSRFLVSIDEEEAAKLKDQYKGQDLARPVCEKLCIPPGSISPDGGVAETATDAGFGVSYCHVVQNGAKPAIYCSGSNIGACIGGRRPRLLAPSEDGCREEDGCRQEPTGSGISGAAFGALARMESAAVLAFVELAVELHAHGAPESLVRRALGAAIEEVSHADIVSRLALSRGVAPEAAVVGVAEVRSFERMLHDNAVEGRAREAWAAIAARADARRAKDPVARQALWRIAVEEAGHAELSEAIETWGFGEARALVKKQVRDARIEEAESLARLVEAGATIGVGAGGGEDSVRRVRAFADAQMRH